jgi:hypothetical protein
MPDLWIRALDDHVPDERNRCRTCRDPSGVAADWPCLSRRVAEEARSIYRGGR